MVWTLVKQVVGTWPLRPSVTKNPGGAVNGEGPAAPETHLGHLQ